MTKMPAALILGATKVEKENLHVWFTSRLMAPRQEVTVVTVRHGCAQTRNDVDTDERASLMSQFDDDYNNDMVSSRVTKQARNLRAQIDQILPFITATVIQQREMELLKVSQLKLVNSTFKPYDLKVSSLQAVCMASNNTHFILQ